MTMMTVRFTFEARRGERRRDGTEVERGVERTIDAFVEGARGRGGRARRVKFCRSVRSRRAASTVERRTSARALEAVEGRANGNDGRITREEMHTFQKH